MTRTQQHKPNRPVDRQRSIDETAGIAMLIAVLVLLLIVIFGPQLWARHILKAHAGESQNMPVSGSK